MNMANSTDKLNIKNDNLLLENTYNFTIIKCNDIYKIKQKVKKIILHD